MYTVSKGPSKIVAKTRRGLSQNYEKFETIKESSKRSLDANSPEKNNVPRPVFQTRKSTTHAQLIQEETITPQHEEIIRYINDSWNIIMAHNPYDNADCLSNGQKLASVSSASSTESVSSCSTFTSASSSTAASSASSSTPASPQPTAAASLYCIEPPSPVLSDFKPFDLESWWGRRLFNNITKSL